MVCFLEIVLRDHPKQVVSLAKAKSAPANMREFLSLAQKHYRIDVASSTVERKTGEPMSAAPCPGGCKDFSRKGSNARRIRETCKICGTVRSEERCPPRQDPTTCSHQHTDHRGSNAHTRKTYCVDCGTYIDSVPREIYNCPRSNAFHIFDSLCRASESCIEGLDDHRPCGTVAAGISFTFVRWEL